MEIVSRLPAPKDPAAVDRLLEAQKLLCARAVDEEDCLQAQKLLQELGAPLDEGGFDYYPALLTLASLSCTGFEPAIEQDKAIAARLYLQFLEHEKSCELDRDLLEEAATQLCSIVKEGTAGFEKAERGRLEDIANGAGAGSLPFVATWARFASHDLDRQIREANEDPKDRERRLAREAARDASRKESLARCAQLTADALARAEELQLEGNDLCRQGQLPGNAKGSVLLTRALELYGAAVAVLSDCLESGLAQGLVPEEANKVRSKRATLQSNAAQVCLSRRDWREARRLAAAAMEDDPENSKSCFRLARAEIELRDWAAAAKTVNDALAKTRGKPGKSDVDDANTMELWKLAEEVSKSLPDFKWSTSKPQAQTSAADFEKRLVGHWQYEGGKYEIKIEPWGALIFAEETIKIDLMRKSKLSWRGEFEQIEGMALVLTYEPGCDMLTTNFIAPPGEEMQPEEKKWKGPTTFTSKRIAAPAPPPSEDVAEDKPWPTCMCDHGICTCGARTAAPPQAACVSSPVEAPAPASVPDDAPRVLWLSGHDDLSGRYELLPDMLQNGRPVYQRVEALADGLPVASDRFFLWYRSGNWSVTKTIHASPLAAPSLARCGDNLGQSQHPLDMRRPRWHVRKGRGQEDLDPAISLSAVETSGSVEQAGYPLAVPATPPAQVAAAAPPPAALEVCGRTGDHDEVNGFYELTPSAGSSMPVYVHSERHVFLFCTPAGYWVFAPEVGTMPVALARCAAPAGVRSPLGCAAAWDFLRGQRHQGHLVSMETRTYERDSSVVLRAAASSSAVSQEAAAREAEHMAEAKPSVQWPAWVADASVELSGSEVKAVVTVREGLSISLRDLQLDVGTEILKVGHPSEGTLSLTLPTAVDTESLPVARISEKTRTLKVRLSVCS